MKYTPIVLLLLVLMASVALCNKSPRQNVIPPELVKREVLLAVEGVRATWGGMQDGGGYQSWTPEKAVEKLLPLLNSASEPVEGEPQHIGFGGKIRYVRDEVTGPWQVVLIANNKKSIIRIEGYGPDISEPVYSNEIAVPKW